MLRTWRELVGKRVKARQIATALSVSEDYARTVINATNRKGKEKETAQLLLGIPEQPLLAQEYLKAVVDGASPEALAEIVARARSESLPEKEKAPNQLDACQQTKSTKPSEGSSQISADLCKESEQTKSTLQKVENAEGELQLIAGSDVVSDFLDWHKRWGGFGRGLEVALDVNTEEQRDCAQNLLAEERAFATLENRPIRQAAVKQRIRQLKQDLATFPQVIDELTSLNKRMGAALDQAVGEISRLNADG